MSAQTVQRLATATRTLYARFTCDCCGHSVECVDKPTEYVHPDFHLFEAEGGYDSKWPTDLNRLEILVCSDCLRTWVASFKTPVEPVPMMNPEPFDVIDSGRDVPAVVYQGWIFDAGEGDLETPESENLDWPDGAPVSGTIWTHYKGGVYEVIGSAHDARLGHDHEFHVVYRALYGESPTFVRPARQWTEAVAVLLGEAPRFRQLA